MVVSALALGGLSMTAENPIGTVQADIDSERKQRRHVGIIVIHGIGVNDLTYAEIFMNHVMDRLWTSEKTRVHWHPVFWADVIRPHQMGYMQRAQGIEKLRFIRMRRFVLSALADAASYSRIGDPNESVYLDIQRKLERAVRHLKDDADPDRPIIIVAHSLGCHIASSYIHDTWKLRSKTLEFMQLTSGGMSKADAVERLKARHYSVEDLNLLQRDENQLFEDRFEDLQSLSGIITLGCNIPVFTFRFHPFQIRPIPFPCEGLPAPFKGKTEWLNFFSPFDPLAFPLKPLSPTYEKCVTEDIPVWCGEGLTFLTPYSHSGYWTNRRVVDRTVRMIRRLQAA
jgi:hypothetical protein